MVTNTALYYGKVNEGSMNKDLKKVATYTIDQTTSLCDVKTAREHLKECKSYIVDDAVSAFESLTYREMLAIEYIHVECDRNTITVSCSGYVWSGARTAGRWWYCYCVNTYTGEKRILILDDNDNEINYEL